MLFILFYKTALITSLYVCLEGLVRLHSKPLLPQQKVNRGGSTEGVVLVKVDEEQDHEYIFYTQGPIPTSSKHTKK